MCKNLEENEENSKREGGIFVFFFFSPCHFSKPQKFVLGVYLNGNFLPGKSISRREKNQEKWLCPLRKKIPITPIPLTLFNVTVRWITEWFNIGIICDVHKQPDVGIDCTQSNGILCWLIFLLSYRKHLWNNIPNKDSYQMASHQLVHIKGWRRYSF